MEIRLHSLYKAIQGESTLAGTPCVIVRLAGCPLRCVYCDTPEAIPVDSGDTTTVQALTQDILAFRQPLCLVTGGEPMAQNATIPLLQNIANRFVYVQIETSGAYDLSNIPEKVRRIIDIKTPGSGESNRNRWDNLKILREGDEIKFVICDKNDYMWAKQIMTQYALDTQSRPILFSPSWNQLDARHLADWIMQDELDVRCHLQQHKLIWGDKGGMI